MNKGILLFGLILLVEVTYCGYLYYQRTSEPTPPIPNLSVVDEITRADMTKLIDETKSPEDWHWLALVFMANGYFSEAKATFQRASELLPDSSDVAFDYGFCLSRVGDIEESTRQFEKAIELKDPKTTEAMFFIGRNYLRAEDPDKAEAAFRKAAKIPLSKFELAKVLFRKGELDEAEELLKEVVRSEPGTVQTFVLRSQIALKRGDQLGAISQSIEASGQWVRIDSPFGEERSKLMKNYASLGYEKAVQEALSLVRSREHLLARRALIAAIEAEWNPVTQDGLIRLSMFTGRMTESINFINERIERFGPSSDVLLKLGQCQMKSDQPEQAIASWLRGAELNTDNSARDCYKSLATYYRDTVGDQKKSEEYQTEGLILYANEVLNYEAFDKALPMANMATRFSPDSAEAAFIMGRVKLGLTQLPEATAAFKRCLELEPTHGRAIQYLEALQEN